MARTSLLILILLSSPALLRAEDDSSKEPSPDLARRAASLIANWSASQDKPTQKGKSIAKTLGEDTGESKNTPAVHVNAAGRPSDPSSRSLGRAGAAGRLKAARRAIILPTPTRTSQATAPTKLSPKGKPSGSIAGSEPSTTGVDSSRRAGTASPTPISAVAEDVGDFSGESDNEEISKVLPSVMKRKPKLGDTVVTKTPTPVVSPQPVAAKESKPVEPSPTLAIPTLAEPPVAASTEAPPTATNPLAVEKAAIEVAALPNQLGNRPDSITRSDTPSAAISPFVETKPIESSRQPAPRSVPSAPRAVAAQQTTTEEPMTEPMQLGGPPLRAHALPASVPSPPKADQPIDEDGKVLLSNRSPVLVVKTHGSRTIRVGRPATYYISAANVGDLAAEDVVVDVSIPRWAEVTENQASSGLVRVQPNQAGNTVVHWTIRKLGAESRQRLRLDLVPRSSRPVELGVTWTFKSVSALAQIQVQEPKLQMSVVGPQDIQFGETKIYTITVSNPGSGDAENVVLTLLPISDGAGSAGTRNLGTIAPGTRRTIEVELTARQAGQLAVRAHTTADGGLQAQGTQEVRVRRAKLEIAAVGPNRKYAGTDARYSIKISNTGDATAQDVVTVASLPLAAKYISSTGGGSFDAERGKVRWSVGSLRPGAFQIVEVSTVLMSAGSNRLEVRSTSADQLSAMAEVATEVESLADLKLTVNDPRGAVAVGSEMTYEVRIINRGTRAAHNVNVVGYFSEGIEPVAVRGWQADVEVGQVVFEKIPRIAPGQEIVVQVAAAASRAGDHVFRTELESNDPETKLAVEEWTRFYGDDNPTTLDRPAERQAAKPRSLPPATLKR